MIFLKVEIRVLAYFKIGMAVLVPGLTKKLNQGKRKSIFGFRTNYLPRFWPSTIRINQDVGLKIAKIKRQVPGVNG